jgi:hypothetical protein
MGAINGTNFLLYKSDIDAKVGPYKERVQEDGGIIEAIRCVRDAFEEVKQVLGHSTNATISLALDLPESTNKNSQGFKEVIAGVKSGTISVEGLVDYTDTVSFADFSTLLLTREKTEFYLQQASGGIVYNGEGFVLSAEQVGTMETASTYSLEIQLTGLYVA